MITKLPAFYDVSHWKEIEDFTKVSPRPLLFGTKATEGTSFVDAKFTRFFAGMQQIDVRRLCYHFHRKVSNPNTQAQHFVNTIKPHITDADILALDVEEGGETAAQLKTWCEYVMSALPHNALWIYSRKNVLESIPTFLAALFPKLADRMQVGQSALDTIQMTLAEREFFRQIPTWAAGYPTNPDLYTSVPSFYIPDPTKWGPVYAWQYSAKGQIAGIIGDVDLNWLSPLAIALLDEPVVVEHQHLFDGVDQYASTRNNRKFWTQIIDPAKVTYEVYTGTRKQVSTLATTRGAKLAVNGGDWDRASGEIKHPPFSPTIIFKGNSIAVSHDDNPPAEPHIFGVRYIVKDGVIPTYLDGLEPQYTEGHSRTIQGITADGKHIQMVSEGVYPNQGLTLKQCAEVMKGYGALQAFDTGGGGDTTLFENGIVLNKTEDIINGVNVERYIPQILLIYPKGATMSKYEATAIGDNTRLRPNHNTDNTYTANYPKDTKFHGDILFEASVVLYNANNVIIQKPGDTWLQVIDVNGAPKTGWVAIDNMGVPICTLKDLTVTPPAPKILSIEITPPAGATVTTKYSDGTQKVETV